MSNYCTEGVIQNILFHKYSRNSGTGTRSKYAVMNTNWKGGYNWECDFHGITWDGFGHEYEIKISLPDLVAELRNKRAKHLRLTTGLSAPEGLVIPQKFYFVICGFTVDDLDLIPAHAGLIELTQDSIHWLRVLKKAPSLNAQQIGFAQLRKAATNLTYNYFNLRTQRGIFNGKL